MPKPSLPQPASNQPKSDASLHKLLYMIEACIDYQNLYALEDSFNKCGLTVQTTPNGKMILCKLRESKPVTNKVIDDYIFVGSNATAINELSDRAVNKICDFVRTNSGGSDTVKNVARVWRNGLRMYESTIPIMNEDVAEITSNLIME